ncbi:putative ribonuclease H2 subunit C [Cryomyces antarcticus]
MLAIQQSTQRAEKCTPNVLPCRIDHNGPVSASTRYWAPETDDKGRSVAYFRGRKLLGRSVKVPDGYRGAVLTKTEKTLQPNGRGPARDTSEDADEEEVEEVLLMEENASFEEIVVWDHGAMPAETEDPYSKGVQEWIALAEAMHVCTPVEDGKTSKPV